MILDSFEFLKFMNVQIELISFIQIDEKIAWAASLGIVLSYVLN